MSFKGIDISNNNGNINFDIVKQNNIKAVYIKATEGVNYIDSKLTYNASAAQRVGLGFGFYHFMSEKTDPKQQAIDFYNAIKKYEYTLIPVLDIENNTLARTKTQVTDRALQFLKKFKELSNIDCIIYTYTSFANSYLDTRLNPYKCWIADYNSSQTVKANNVWNSFVGHQYTGTGRISGVSGNVDINNFEDGIFINTNNKTSSVINTQQQASQRIDVVEVAKNYLGNSANVKKVQYILNCFGNSLSVDGICGSSTTNAIGEFQSKNGLTKDYKFGPASMQKAYKLLKNTMCGLKYKTPNQTKLIQYLLGISIDGIFGKNTESAVKNYQSKHGLNSDGIVGANTWKVLLGL